MISRFRVDGVDLELEKRESIFLYLSLSYLLDGVAMTDHDFANVLGMSRQDAEAFLDSLVESERVAKERSTPWNLTRWTIKKSSIDGEVLTIDVTSGVHYQKYRWIIQRSEYSMTGYSMSYDDFLRRMAN